MFTGPRDHIVGHVYTGIGNVESDPVGIAKQSPEAAPHVEQRRHAQIGIVQNGQHLLVAQFQVRFFSSPIDAKGRRPVLLKRFLVVVFKSLTDLVHASLHLNGLPTAAHRAGSHTRPEPGSRARKAKTAASWSSASSPVPR